MYSVIALQYIFMRLHSLLVVTTFALLYGCQKNEAVRLPANGSIFTTLHASDTVLPTPYTDTFSGIAIEADPAYTVLQTACEVYAHYLLDGNVYFSSSYRQDLQYAYHNEIGGFFYINDSNIYSFGKRSDDYSFRFKVTNDTLFFTGSQEICPDVFVVNFAGKRISRDRPHR